MYPRPLSHDAIGGPLTPVRAGRTTHGFSAAPRKWNSWGIQINLLTTPSSPAFLSPLTNQSFIIKQCNVLADADILAAGYNLCSLDGSWYSSVTDDHGRITYNKTRFDLPALGKHLHSRSLKLGLYNMPNIPCEAANKAILGTNVTDRYDLCYFNYCNPNTQLYHNSMIDLWASWGTDMIKLEYITPGSIVQDFATPPDTSGAAIAYHRAILNSGRQIRLDLSSNICRNNPYLDIWDSTSDSIHLAVDINNQHSRSFVGMWKIQGTIEQCRQYINQLVHEQRTMTARPDLDNLFIANPASVSKINDPHPTPHRYEPLDRRRRKPHLRLGSNHPRRSGPSDPHLSRRTSRRRLLRSVPMQPRNPGSGGNQARQLQT
ncbi:uncharacterized protein KD926_004763 [Aspergillus affinis]|uniref:uncharacterized protein n=1 Tax=Aspergillus affinis TaxID=1070780 RepID=UPI0022FF251E|nr:uncharacterized protein KD926_004763 [Aspergillus affinis]KAI9042972.1 hypothetical protein KD926_004763 [Aspergillus affinis]